MRVKVAALSLAVIAAFHGGAAQADVKAGYDLWQRGAYAAAVNEWRPLAIAGDMDAQFNLAQAYKLGRGVPMDLKQAEDWFRRAADQGHVGARGNLGLIMFQNGRRAEAMPLIEEAAGHGDPRAQYVYGTALFNGDLVAKDWVRAYALMSRAAAQGLPAAKSSLAQMDKFIPADQRMRGIQLAGAFEAHDAATATDPADARTVGESPAASLPPARPEPVAPPPRRPVETAEAPPPPPVRVVKPPKPARPVAEEPAPVRPAVGGRWRVQLAALSDSRRANALWQSLHGRIGALAPYSPYIYDAGNVVRVQAGPLVSKEAAVALCAKVRAAGQSCVPVAP